MMLKRLLLCLAVFCLVATDYAQQTFTTYQAANLVVGQSNFTSSTGSCTQASANGPSYCAISSQGMLAVTNQTGNRTQLWKNPITTNGQLPDIVLGETGFTSCTGGTTQSLTGYNNGVAFSPDGNKIIIADYDNRVLIWNNIPSSNGQPADVVLGQPNFTSSVSGTAANKMSHPSGVYVSGNGKLIISDADNNRVLIWNSIPTSNGAPADVVVGQPDFTTSTSGSAANKMFRPWGVWVSPDGKLLVADEKNNRVLVFNSIPTANNANADLVIGQTGFGLSGSGTSQSTLYSPIGVTVSPDGKLAIGEFGNNRVLIYNTIPSVNGAAADVVLGQPNFTSATGSISSQNMSRPYNVSFDLYGRLFVTGREMNRVMVFGTVPTQQAELQIQMNADSITFCPGSSASVTVTLTNNGPDTASGIIATASLPATFTFGSAAASVGTYNSVSGYWNVNTLAPGEIATLTIFGVSSSSGVYPAYSNIIQSNQIDNNLTNNAASIAFDVNCPCTGTPDPGNTVSSSYSVCQGESFTLALQNTLYTGGVMYQWQSSADDITYSTISGATSSTYTTNQAKYYRCIVTCSNSGLSDTSGAVYILVNSSPSISVQPVNSAVLSGTNTAFSVSATGTGLTFQWQVNTGSGFYNLSNTGVYSNVTTATLNITNTAASMNGYQYRCIVNGTCSPSATSNYAILSVNNPPCSGTPTAGTIVSSINPVCNNVNFTLSLSGVSANVTGLTFLWQSSSDGNTYSGIANTTASSYAANQASSQYYRCIVTCSNSGFSDTSSFIYVSTNYAPSVTVQPVNSVILTGTSTAFSVSATGTGLTYQWQVNTGSGFYNLGNTGVYSNVTMPTMNISNATIAMDGYLYRCVVSGTCSPSATSNSAMLTVNNPPCTGTPAAGTAITSSNPVCSGVNFMLNLSGATANASDLAWQWQSSADGSTFTNISGATSAPYTASQASAQYYRCIIVCSNSGLSDTSTVLYVAMNSVADCYCTSAASSASDEEILNVTVGSLNNSSTCNTTGGAGSLLKRYSNFKYIAAPILTAGISVAFSVQIGTCGSNYSSGTAIFIDYNQNGSFADAGEKVYGTSGTTSGPHYVTGNFTVPVNAALGNTVMRVINAESYSGTSITSCLAYSFGETEDYTVNIIGSTPCSGIPSVGAAASTSNPVCSGSSFLLSLPGLDNSISNLTFQWQSSTDGTTYSNITGATNSTYTTSQTSAHYYRCIVICTNSGLSDTSSVVNVAMKMVNECYCIPDSSASACDYMWITNITTSGGVADFNNSSACASSSYSDFSGSVSASNLQLSTTSMTFTAYGYAMAFSVWIDYNSNGIFESSEKVISNSNSGSSFTVTGSFTVPSSVAPGAYKMRVRGEYYTSGAPIDPCSQLTYGETEDYTFTVIAATPCSGTPAPGNTVSTAYAVCSGTAFTLSLQNAINTTGIQFQWQISTDGIAYSNISGATSSAYSTSQTSAGYYRCIVTCTNSGLADTSGSAYIQLNTAPSISIQPSGSSILAGSNASFSVTAGGTGITYQWQINTGSGFYNLSNSGVYSNVTTSTLTITNATISMNGYQYRCVITGVCYPSTTSNNATLNVGNAPCTGIPSAGTAVSTKNPVCNAENFTLSLSGASANSSGLTFQWQSSTDGASYANISGATASTYTTSQVSAHYYRCIVACTNSGLSDTSTVINVVVSMLADCYCASAASSASDEEILNVTVGSLNNSSTCSTTGGAGSLLNRYSDFKYITAPSLTENASVSFSVYIGTCGGNYSSGTAIFIDYNQNGSFADAGEKVYGTSGTTSGPHYVTGSFTVPSGAATGTTVMRVINAESYSGASITPCQAYTYGETEDYSVNIIAATPCSGNPNPGNTISTDYSVCTGINFMLSLQTPYSFSGITYQWQSSADGNTYVNISGATGATYTAAQTSAQYYRCIVTCSNSGLTGTSVAAYVAMDSSYSCYCVPAASVYPCSSMSITNVLTTGGITNFNNGSGCADSSYTDFSDSVTASNTQLSVTSFTFSSSGYAMAFSVWIDFNSNGIFEYSERVIANSNTGALLTLTNNFTVPASVAPGTYKMRIRGEYYSSGAPSDPCSQLTYGETEDYTFIVVDNSACIDAAISPSSQLFTSAGGGDTVMVTAPTACNWVAVSNSSWITITSGNSGAGNGAVNYFVDVNTGASRTGTITVAGQIHTVSQSGITAPANDECAGAIALTSATSCNYISGITTNATQSSPPILCNTYTGSADDDIWYSFSAVTSNHTIKVQGLSGFDPVVDLRSGTCSGTNIACADSTYTDGLETLYATGLSIGSIYYIRLYDYNAGSTGNFQICVMHASPVGLDEMTANDQLSIYPNPNNGEFTILTGGEGEYVISDELGRIIRSVRLNEANKFTVNIELLSNGIYYLSGMGGNSAGKRKIVVIK